MNNTRTESTSLKAASMQTMHDSFAVGPDDRILITGAAGFIGCHVVESLVNLGFRNLVCFTKSSSESAGIKAIIERRPIGTRIEIIKGNLLSRVDCEAACEGVVVILHLAAGTGEKSFPDAFMNSVVTTRNLLEATLGNARFQRFVLVSSFSVYTNRQRSRRLDESSPIEEHPERRGDAYCYAKVKQEQMVSEYAKNFGIPYVVVRPGSVYGAGASGITGRVGLGTFGFFLHLGGSNTIPFTHVENCADAIALAGIVKGIDGEVFNVVDDNLPSSRHFLRQYKKNVESFKSVYVPHVVCHALCSLWEKYSHWSMGQLPPVFTRSRWYSEWKKTSYSNEKLKHRLGWTPKVSMEEGLQRFFQSCRQSKYYA
jgi:nucleoside-diphosphate-sugar epimerase